MTETLVSLSLGNGTRFDVILNRTEQGLLLSVVRHGCYFFSFVPNYSYVAQKLNVLDGDAICLTRFLAAQLSA